MATASRRGQQGSRPRTSLSESRLIPDRQAIAVFCRPLRTRRRNPQPRLLFSHPELAPPPPPAPAPPVPPSGSGAGGSQEASAAAASAAPLYRVGGAGIRPRRGLVPFSLLSASVSGEQGAMNSSKEALIYSFVAKGSVVLAEHTAFSGNFSTVAVQCLQRLPPNSTRSTYSCDGHTFNFLIDRGFVFLVVADEAAGRSVAFVFLERVREDFMQRYGSTIDEEGQHPLADDADEDDFLFEGRFNIAYNLDREFGPRLKDHMQYCVNHPEEINKVSKVKAHLSEVKGIMMDNIEKILDRGEKIELLVGKTETLQSQADSFHRHGRELRRKMWLQNLRFKLMVGGGIAALILILWLMVCRGFKC